MPWRWSAWLFFNAAYCISRIGVREQFTFVAGQLDRFGLAYLHVVDGLAFGFHNLGAPMTMTEFRQGYTDFPAHAPPSAPGGK